MTFRLTCMAGELARALQLASQTAGREKQIPILRAVRIAVTKDGATISATNNDHGVTVSIAAEGEGTAYVDIGLILPKAQVMRPSQPVTLTSEDGKFIEMKQGRTGLKAPMLDGDAFPVDMTKAVDGKGITVAAGPLLHAFSVAPDAIWPGISQPMYMGALLDMEGGKFRVVATSGKVLSVMELDIPAFDRSIIIPNEAMAAIRSMFKDAETLEIVATESALSVSGNEVTYHTRLIEGRFPDWRRVVAGENIENIATIDPAEVLGAVIRASAVSEEKAKDGSFLAVWVNIDDGELLAKASSKIGEAGEDTCPTDGPAGEFVVNSIHIRRMLGNIGASKATITYPTTYNPDVPVIIRAYPSERENYRAISQVRAAK